MNRVVLAIAFVVATALTAGGAVLPPPVNQTFGLPDTVFNNFTETGCRSCHNPTPPPEFPVDPTYLPDRHHLQVGLAIPALNDVPNKDANGDGIADTTYSCYSCHKSVWNPVTFSWALDPNFRDCMVCHIQTATSGATVHHRGQTAQDGKCADCHGWIDAGLLDTNNNGIIAALDATEDTNGDGYADGGWIPSYQPSLVTPYPSKKPANGVGGTIDDRTSNIFGEKEGSCKFCHSNLTGLEGAPADENSGYFAPVKVYTNSETHHSTGFYQDTTKCLWCHSFAQSEASLKITPIRTCEICHGIPSLHNIQADSNADSVIKPGAENAGFGHLGAQWDCDGCHGFDSTTTSSAPQSGPVIPALYTLSASAVQAGAATVIDLHGTAFINQIQNPMTGAYDITVDSDVALIDANGNQTVLEPISCFFDTIKVAIPAGVPAGSYKIAAKKGPKLSNPLNLAVTPAVTVASAAGVNGTVTLNGAGFASYMDAADSGTGVTATVTYTVGTKKKKTTTTQTVNGVIQSWTDTQIVAQFPSAPTAVTVNTIFGSVANVPVQ